MFFIPQVLLNFGIGVFSKFYTNLVLHF